MNGREDTPQAAEKPKINHFVVLGDSLSDTGMLWDAEFLGLFPLLRLWSGLVGTSPKHEFSNGDVWVVHFLKWLVNKLEENTNNVDHVADNVFEWKANGEYKDFVRNFSEGGVTAHHYLFSPSARPTAFAARFVLSSLQYMRYYLLQHDIAKNYDKLHKVHALVTEWTGANDLITVNDEPTDYEVDLAIKARIKNVKILIRNGYKNFRLNDLPDLSKTPRDLETKTPAERAATVRCIAKLSKKLIEEVNKLKQQYPQCNIDVYKISDDFEKIYQNPEKYGLDRNKLTKSLRADKNYPKDVKDDMVIPSDGYAFWDGLHPTDLLSHTLGIKTGESIESQYEICAPGTLKGHKPADLNISENELINIFKNKYKDKLAKDGKYFFGVFGGAKLYDIYGKDFCHTNPKLKDIFNRAFSQDCRTGMRTFRVMCSLGWINDKGELLAENVRVLREAYTQTKAYQSQFKM